jgi:outer membrane lipoprotein SlyB
MRAMGMPVPAGRSQAKDQSIKEGWVMRIIAIMSVVGLLASGCGTMVGAGAGGLAGNQFGKGTGKGAATAAGVIGGGVIGHALTGD